MIFVGCQSISDASFPDTKGQYDPLSQVLDSNAGKNNIVHKFKKNL